MTLFVQLWEGDLWIVCSVSIIMNSYFIMIKNFALSAIWSICWYWHIFVMQEKSLQNRPCIMSWTWGSLYLSTWCANWSAYSKLTFLLHWFHQNVSKFCNNIVRSRECLARNILLHVLHRGVLYERSNSVCQYTLWFKLSKIWVLYAHLCYIFFPVLLKYTSF